MPQSRAQKLFLVLSCSFGVLFSILSFAQSSGRNRLDGSISGGYAQLNTLTPTTDFKINSGTTVNLQAEKPFGSTPLYLTVGLNYIKTSGSLNYNYVGASGVAYSSTNVNFGADDFQVDLGLRLKLFDSSPVRLYVEGGGDAGYLQLSYDNSLKTAVGASGSDYKTLDQALEFGYYGEGGLEFQLHQSFGLRLVYRYLNNITRPFQTLKNQTVNYAANMYYGGLFFHF